MTDNVLQRNRKAGYRDSLPPPQKKTEITKTHIKHS
jgi:hypothetical protein